MAFTFQKYGTFAGPGVDIDYRDNDDFSLDPFSGYWNIDDVSMVLANVVESPSDYVYMHLNGFDTSVVTLERSQGNIPTFNVNADQTNFDGDVDINGNLDVVGTIYAKALVFNGGTGGTSAGATGDFSITGKIDATGNIVSDSDVKSNGGSHVLSNKKNLPFDMPHPNKPGWRLRHVCIEGPEISVYCRGRVPSDGIINLPSFWDGLINPEDMTINITPIGCWQELFVKEILWGKQVIIQNNAGGQINANYHIIARRLDDDLVVEYEGKSHEDYPGGNEGYSFNFEHNYVKNLIQETAREYLEKTLDTDP